MILGTFGILKKSEGGGGGGGPKEGGGGFGRKKLIMSPLLKNWISKSLTSETLSKNLFRPFSF